MNAAELGAANDNKPHVCDHCQGKFGGRKKKYCTTKCRLQAKYRRENPGKPCRTKEEISAGALTSTPHECGYCGDTFYPKGSDRTKFCSRACAFKFKGAVSALKSVSFTVTRAKCGHCGEWFEVKPRNRKFCSQACGLIYQRQTYKDKTRSKWDTRRCKECDASFTPLQRCSRPSEYCSAQCARRYNGRIGKKKRRAVMRGVQSERVNPIDIFVKAEWRCQLCGTETPRILRGTYEPNAPELDHVIPLARGGAHANDNVQLLCRQCNASKGDQLLAV